jgi:GT2 family glycosyltransferase/glycosyltransferase involved in cell wall biosynthesis
LASVSIIIPVYNALDFAEACIESIYASASDISYEVILVDNGSEAQVRAWGEDQQRSRLRFRYLHFDHPLGFSGAMNAGAAMAQGTFLVLLNSDTLVTNGWLDKLAKVLAENPPLGIVGPVTNKCGHDIQKDAAAKHLYPAEAQAYAARIASRKTVVMEPQRLVFFCVMIRHSLWQMLNGLDEAFIQGNFEDDDFCVRTRLAGYGMAIAMDAFVFHNEGKTFSSNSIDHNETMVRNRALFGERVARWSKTRPMQPLRNRVKVHSVSVIVPAMPDRASGLRDTLNSLLNQTVQSFETIVAYPYTLGLAAELAEYTSVMRLKDVSVAEWNGESPAELLNAGIHAASGELIAYLPAADVFYPFHLEKLASSLASGEFAAAHTAWSVAVTDNSRTRREVLEFIEARPEVECGDWSPLVCWMHHRNAASGVRFDPSLGGFCGWDFVIRLSDRSKPRYFHRVTCERTPDASSARAPRDVQRILAAHPASKAATQMQRQQFLAAVAAGGWENRLIISRNEVVRRAVQMLQRRPPLPTQMWSDLRRRLQSAEDSAIVPARVGSHKDIFLFSIIEWTTLTQRPQHFAQGLASRGYRVFWVGVQLRPPNRVDADSLIYEMAPNLYHVQLPGEGETVYRLKWTSDILDAIKASFSYLRKTYGIQSAVQLVNFPRWEPLNSLLKESFGWEIVYDCLDDQAAFAELFGHPYDETEPALIKKSAKVITSGEVLQAANSAARPDTLLIPNGVDFDVFGHATSAGLLDGVAKPIIGFFGAFAEWLDLDWVEAAATKFPEWSFVYIGTESFSTTWSRNLWHTLAKLPNIHVVAQVPPFRLQQYLAQFDVCIMPFRNIAITRSMNAVKLYEYLAAGKPVLVPDLPETTKLLELGLVEVYRSDEESFELLSSLVASGMNPDKVARRIDYAKKNTWQRRVDALCAALEL